MEAAKVEKIALKKSAKDVIRAEKQAAQDVAMEAAIVVAKAEKETAKDATKAEKQVAKEAAKEAAQEVAIYIADSTICMLGA